MKINGYEINFTESELDDILNSKTRIIEFISPDFEGYEKLSENDKKALLHLVKAAKIINDVALEQDHPLNKTLKYALERTAMESSYAQKALELFNSLNGVAGFNGIDKEPIQIFKNVQMHKGKNFYPTDLSIEEFHQILLKMANRNKIDDIRKILSARTMVRRKDDELTAIDYTQYFSKEFSQIANELESASKLCSDENFKQYLIWQAQALLHDDEKLDMIADKYWASLQASDLEFTISRENYEDDMTSSVYQNKELSEIIEMHNIEVVAKDTLGCRVGIVNKPETEYILDSKKTLPHLMNWMPYNDKYEQSLDNQEDLKQTMVDADIVALTGDYAMCRGGITLAQNLPNNDKLSVKTGGGRRNVYHRQVRFGKDVKQELLDSLLAPEFHQYIDVHKDMIFVIYHENGHSLGPKAEYQNAMGEYKHIIEENKADVVSIASISEIAKTFNMFSEEDVKKIYASWIFSNLLLKAEPVYANPHRVASLIHFNYLTENKVIWFNENNKLCIDFD
ncbi:MAG: hypothetical protein IJW75_02465, partial [Alphaproteobacteria bacterium]|nr:hypothetical protein [Alphaproteobacteria bacterium]